MINSENFQKIMKQTIVNKKVIIHQIGKIVKKKKNSIKLINI